MLIHDVTQVTRATNQTKITNDTHLKSSITPFQKVLNKVQVSQKEDESTDITKLAEQSKSKEVSASDNGTSSISGKASLKSVFERAAEKYDISYDFLVAVAKAESDFNPKCVSSAGAMGIMQIMPYEQKELGVKDPYDPEQNIMAAAKLLKAHLKKFKGDYTLAAAAYNAGSGRVQKYGGVPPIKETQNYVKKIEKFMKEGVTVPDHMVKVSDKTSTNKSESAKKATKSVQGTFDTGKMATKRDWEKVTVAIGAGDSTLTMSYGAYLKYLEMGSSGVG